MHIRVATALDSDAIRNVHLCASPDEEKHQVASLATDLPNEHTQPETLSLIAKDFQAGKLWRRHVQ
jgi:hypothetical protein